MALSEDNQQLRELARAVMAGELARDEYRRQRRVLIDRYAGEQPVPVSVPAATAADSPTLPELRAVVVPPEPAEPAPAVDAGRSHDLLLGMVAIAVVLAVLGGVLAWFW